MWTLSQFRYDELIDAPEVYLDAHGDGLELMRRDDAIAVAHAAGLSLVAEFPATSTTSPTCTLAKVVLPLRWEQLPEDGGEDEPDPVLWFEASCGGRDLLLEGQGKTFLGRLSAWCPHAEVSYRVSFHEMGAMSEATRYFVRGFLDGSAPSWPIGDEGESEPDDLQAWRSAVRRFRTTGTWYGRWGTCGECGCVLLPDRAGDRCGAHAPD